MPFAPNLQPHEIDIYVMNVMRNKISSCKSRGIEWKLTFVSLKNLMKAKKCFYTGIELTIPAKEGIRPTDFSIDRIDSTKPYEKGNVVACSHAANQLKAYIENPANEILTMKMAEKVFRKTNKHLDKQ